MTGPELARRLEVNVRTVRDYIEMLGDLGIPVEAERGRNGAYRLRPGYKLPPLMFTEDEALALTLSLLMARENGLAQTTPSFEGALAKIERVLPASIRERIRAVGQTVVFEDSSPHAVPPPAAVMMLSSAVQNEQSVRLRYRSARGEVTERAFNPYGVVSHEGFWYTIGYCHLRKAQRLLRLDRILRVEKTDERFLRPANFEALAAVQRALASVPRAWQVEVWLEATLEEAGIHPLFWRPEIVGRTHHLCRSNRAEVAQCRERRKLRTDQTGINKGLTVRSRGRSLRTFVLLFLERLYK
jgi:predicted DNA-binding transcriptional regulator YafY